MQSPLTWVLLLLFELITMTRPTWEVLVLPSAGNGNSYWDEVEAQNASQAKKIIKSRIPSDWKVGNNPKRV